MSFYKYARPGNAGYVAACTLRFSPAREFNDPFDGLPDTAAFRALPAYQQLKKEWTDLAKLDPADPELARGAVLAGELIEKKATAIRALKPGVLALVAPQSRLKSLKFLCPCGCGTILTIMLAPSSNRAWRYEFDSRNRLSLWPSVRLSSGCQSHFTLRRNVAHLIVRRAYSDCETDFEWL